MTAIIQTIDTPDGAFTIVADERGRVLASGWTADADAAIARIHPRLRPDAVREAQTDAAAAVAGLLRGRPRRDRRRSRSPSSGTELQLAGWEALRRIEPGEPLTYAEFAAALGQPRRRAGRGIDLRAQRAGAVRPVPPRAALGRVARRLRVGTRSQASLLAREAAA